MLSFNFDELLLTRASLVSLTGLKPIRSCGLLIHDASALALKRLLVFASCLVSQEYLVIILLNILFCIFILI